MEFHSRGPKKKRGNNGSNFHHPRPASTARTDTSTWDKNMAPKRGRTSANTMMRRNENSGATSKPFGFRRLDALSEMPGLKIMEILAVQKTMVEFVELSNQADLKDDFIARIVKILGKLARIEFDKIVVQLLSQISTIGFLQQLLCYIVNFQEKVITEADHKETFEVFDSITAFSHTVSKLLPTLACEKFPPILKQCKVFLVSAQVEGMEKVQELINICNITLEKISVEKEKRTIQPVKTTIAEEALQFALPPEDFRDLSTVPMEHDLSSRHFPFLRPNITHGPYKDVEHYLDVQFRLLREDFVRPLRDGINEYIQKKREAGNMKRIRVNNIKMYEMIIFGKAHVIEDKVAFPVNFDPLKKFCSNINWDQSKRFMLGSLLILTKDGFQTITLAKVLKRSKEDLSEGWVLVEIVDQLPDCSVLYYGQWIMAESNLFFGAYSHVLEALKTFDEVNFPLKSYIVEGRSEAEMPSYLSTHNEILYKLPHKEESKFKPSDLLDLDHEAPFLSVNLRNNETWPSPNELGLDESQYEAYKGALTQKVMLIQGPPGTGKTFLGLKVATTLLRNHDYWQNTSKRPMVVVCYTNHALDQFLMGLSTVTSSIVRVGGGSKEKTLEKFSIRNMSRNLPLGGSLISMLKEYRHEFSELKEGYHGLEKAISVLEKGDGIVDPDCLIEWGILTDRQAQSFESRDDVINWLIGLNPQIFNGMDVSSLILEFKEDIGETVQRILLGLKEDPSRSHQNLYFCLTFSQIQDILEKGKLKWKNFQENLLHMRHQMKNPITDPKNLNINEVNKLRSLKRLPVEKRWQLYRYWVGQLVDILKNKMTVMQPKLLKAAANLKQARMVEDQCIMSKCQVIGMTTTYAASKQSILKQLKPSIGNC